MKGWTCKLTVVDDNGKVVREIEVPASEVLFEHPEGSEDLLTTAEYLDTVDDDQVSELMQQVADGAAMARAFNIRNTCLHLNPRFPEKHLEKITPNSLIYVNFNWAGGSWLYDLPFVRLSDEVEPGQLVLVIDPATDPFWQHVIADPGGCH